GLAWLAGAGERRDGERLVPPGPLDPPVAADPAVHEQRGEHVAIALVPEPFVVGRAHEALAELRVVAAEDGVELRDQPYAGQVATGCGLEHIGVRLPSRALAPGQIQPVEERVHLAEPEPGPPGDVATARGSVRRDVEPDRGQQRLVGHHTLGQQGSGRAVPRSALTGPGTLQRPAQEPAVAERQVAPEATVDSLGRLLV